jgi:hypothetical protein
MTMKKNKRPEVKKLIILLGLVLLILSCDNEGPSSITGGSGPGVWCVTRCSLDGMPDLYYLNKYSFEGQLLYRSEPQFYIEDMEVKNDSGILYYIENKSRIVKRDDSGAYLSDYSVEPQTTITDISFNQNDGSIWILKNPYWDWVSYVLHTDASYNTLLEDIPINWSFKLSCNQNNNSCLTNGYLLEYEWDYFLVINEDGNVSWGSQMDWTPYYSDSTEYSTFDNTCWIAMACYLNHYNSNGGLLQENTFSGYTLVDMKVDQNDGSVYVIQEIDDVYTADPANDLIKCNSEGQILWLKNLDCTAVTTSNDSTWVGINPNTIMQLSPNGEILKQFPTYGVVTDLAIWNG